MKLKKKLLLLVINLLCAFIIPLFLLYPAFGQQSSSQSLDLKNSQSLNADLQINAGILKLSAHNQPKADVSFTFSRNAWKPQVKLTKQATVGYLSVKQPEEKNMNMQDKERNEWNIKLPQTLPTNLKLRMGAGEGTVDLHGAKINRFEMDAGAGNFKVNMANTSVANLNVNAGVGALTLNLSGSRTRNLNAAINGGIGDLTLILPRKIGVRVKVSGLGGVESAGLRKQGGYYVNEAYGKTPQSLDITVSAGMGNIKMELEN